MFMLVMMPRHPPKAITIKPIKIGDQIKVMRDLEDILMGKLSRYQAAIFMLQNNHLSRHVHTSAERDRIFQDEFVPRVLVTW